MPRMGFASGPGTDNGGSTREEFLRKFANDPTAIKAAPVATPTPAEVETSAAKNPTKNLENLLKNFRKEGLTVRPERSAPRPLPTNTNSLEDPMEAPAGEPSGEAAREAIGDEDEGQVKGTIDVSALKNLQGLMGSGNGNVSPAELLKKMHASGMAVPGIPGAPAGGSGDYSLIVYQMLNPFRSQSEAEVTQIFTQKMAIGPMGILINVVPFANKIPNLIARIARDEKALPSVVKIVNQRGKLTQYATFVLVTFIISFVVKRLKQKQDASIFSGMKSGMMRAIFMTGLRLAVFLVLFSSEFAPLWQVIKKSF
ncbi:MAG: hypothetical protein AABY86_11770 [Bdellovibrionota bacterium]